MNSGVLRAVLVIALSAVALVSQAVTYGAPMNHAEWRLEASPFECRLWQPIPVYGDAIFATRAGEEQRFYLSPRRNPMAAGKAALVSKAPVWDAGRKVTDLGYVPVKNQQKPVELRAKLATRLLNELYEGMAPVFTRRAWFGDDVSVKVALSSVNFRKAYSQYRDCLVELLPVNFEQISRSRIHFATAKWDLSPQARERLDLILEYVKVDTSITGFYIDGHTDDVGRRLYNLDLSKKRAETVSRYLAAKGIDETLITTRYHGERYPVTPNKNAASRQKNRRVTIRLDRGEI